jgi:hypothetical protein
METREVKIEGGTKILPKFIKPKERRFPCGGDCGRDILHFFNPTGYCRKCQKKNKRHAIRVDSKRRRGTL